MVILVMICCITFFFFFFFFFLPANFTSEITNYYELKSGVNPNRAHLFSRTPPLVTPNNARKKNAERGNQLVKQELVKVSKKSPYKNLYKINCTRESVWPSGKALGW